MAKKKLKLKQVRCYRSVPLGAKKTEFNSFSVVDIPGRPKIDIEIASINEATVVRVSTEDDCVDIPFSNIACIQYFNKMDAEIEEQKKANEDAMAENISKARDTAKRPA